MIKSQKDFPYYKQFKKKFPITENTIFIFDGNIFTDKEMPHDIYEHEIIHLEQQSRIGAKKWINKYLKSPKFRLKQELEAYRRQLEVIPKEEYKDCLNECAENISSSLYGNLLTYEQAILRLTNK